MPRILRDSLRTFSSSDDQPSSLSEPAHGTTFSASGAGNGDSAGRPASASAAATSPPRTPTSLPATAPRARPAAGRCRAGPHPTPPGTTRRPAPRASNSRCSAPIAAIIDSVVQLGFAMIPFGRFAAASALTSGTTSGTSGSIRNAPELSTATAPRSAAIGAHRALTSSGTSNSAMSTPSKTSGASAWTVTSSPRTRSTLPADRGEATSRISLHGTLGRASMMSIIVVPTAPVAPTIATTGPCLSCITAPFPRAPRRARRRPARTPRAARARRRRAAPHGRSPRSGSRRCSSSRC